MNTLETLEQRLRGDFPDLVVELDRPADPNGVWILDLVQDGHEITVEWKPSRGFGVSATPLSGYGEGPEEVFTDPEEVFHRLVDLVNRRGRTRPPQEVMLRHLREELQMTQQQLADLMGVNQPAIAKLERRKDMNFSTLRRVIGAMGGELDIVARFPGNEVHICLFDEDADTSPAPEGSTSSSAALSG